MDNTNTTRGTRAHSPDLDWSQVRETVLMLELAAAQIEAAMRDSNSSVEVLTDTFTSMAGYMRMISETAHALPATPDTEAVRQNLNGTVEQVSGMVHQAIIAFQFYDKLVQRLSHVCHSLGNLGDLVNDKSRLFNPQEWVELQQGIKSKYSTLDEVAMFEAVMSGMPVLEAIEQYMTQMKNKGDDIELF
ncbi:MAG: hypothetical protein RIR00_1799 [Pseudomonadota bacterium]|jgi:hypothetical protein